MLLKGVVSQAQVQGPRDYQEDRTVRISYFDSRKNQSHLLGIFDGHQSYKVAEYCANKTPKLFDSRTPDTKDELRHLVTRLDARTRLMESGSTLSLAHIHIRKWKVTTAVLGDSPIVVVDWQNKIHISEEHNVRSNVPEREAAIRRGAEYIKGYIFPSDKRDGLQMSRALGDFKIRSILDQTPTITEYKLGPQSLVIVMSDGMLDPNHMNSRSYLVRDLVEVVQKSKNAREVLAWREAQKLDDNASIIFWKGVR